MFDPSVKLPYMDVKIMMDEACILTLELFLRDKLPLVETIVLLIFIALFSVFEKEEASDIPGSKMTDLYYSL